MWPGKSSLKSNRLGFLEHLEEFRGRLLIILAAIGAFSAAAWFFSKPLIEFLALPLAELGEGELYFQAPYDAFLVHLKVSILAGLLLATPVLFTQLWLFAAPGLHQREKKILFPLVLISVFLFLAGAAFAFWGIVPFGLRFLLSYQTHSLRPLLSASSYFSFLIGMILASGITFDLPVAVLGLVRLGLLDAQALRIGRKAAIVLILVLTAVLTPSPDPVGQVLLALPLFLLYEACIWIASKTGLRHPSSLRSSG